MPIDTLLQASALSCERGNRLLWRDLNFSLPKAEILQVLGPNGSGKTSLLRVLTGILQPSAGEVLWQGHNIMDDLPHYHQHIFYQGHLQGIKLDLTVMENLCFSWQKNTDDFAKGNESYA